MKKKTPVPENANIFEIDSVRSVSRPGNEAIADTSGESADPASPDSGSISVVSLADPTLAGPDDSPSVGPASGVGVTDPDIDERTESPDFPSVKNADADCELPEDITTDPAEPRDAVNPEAPVDVVNPDADVTIPDVDPSSGEFEDRLVMTTDEPSLFSESDELIFTLPEHEDPDIQGTPAIRISEDSSLFEPHVRKLSWLKPRHIVTPLVAIAVVLLFVFVIYIGPKNERAASPLMIRGIALSRAEFSFMYHYVLLENGIDIRSEEGRKMLASSPENDFETYRDLFLDMTAKEMQTTAILYDDAVAHGYSIGPEYTEKVQSYLDWLGERAAATSVDLETYIIGTFGESVTRELILEVLSRKFFTEDYAYGQKLEELRASEDQAEEAYLSSPNQYDQVSYRLLRIVFEQKDDNFIATAHLHAREIIEKIGHDQSKFESVAAEYFSGEAKEKLLQPDSTLIYGVRFNDVINTEWRVWLFDPQRKPGDCIIYEDEDGFPILLCFSSRQRQIDPLRDVRIFLIRQEDPENGVPGVPAVDIVARSNIILHSITDEASIQDLEKSYAEDIAAGIMSITQSSDTRRGKLDPVFDEWVFDRTRKPGDKTSITTPEGIAILFFVSSSENPEWYDRVNSFIRMNNFQEFLVAKQAEYPYKFNPEGLKGL